MLNIFLCTLIRTDSLTFFHGPIFFKGTVCFFGNSKFHLADEGVV